MKVKGMTTMKKTNKFLVSAAVCGILSVNLGIGAYADYIPSFVPTTTTSTATEDITDETTEILYGFHIKAVDIPEIEVYPVDQCFRFFIGKYIGIKFRAACPSVKRKHQRFHDRIFLHFSTFRQLLPFSCFKKRRADDRVNDISY